MKADLPSSHDVSVFIHNTFIDFLHQISTTMDLWSVDQTKVAFLSITAHFIEVKQSCILCSQVIAFRGISGAHTGQNLGWYFIALCEHVGIVQVGTGSSQVSDQCQLLVLMLHHLLCSFFV
ncbi:hypothetical protein PAXRUDRAFT_150008 [Paxillus rubicundulus Ve08.2h10]|uniref:Uncharacterized protein n=1 Tax=Paxillus rubicundulus Ve08.2h10 TaxID=930991 RepID=A0A0D0DJD6_9AGAM|nr:hypothetical protein PAXRUDRAFT_150008 [Paxillus rubicundulus Ve08.2h10]